MRTDKQKRRKSAFVKRRRELEAILYEEAKKEKDNYNDGYIGDNILETWTLHDPTTWKKIPLEKVRLNRRRFATTVLPMSLSGFVRETLKPFLDDKVFGFFDVQGDTATPEGVYIIFSAEQNEFYSDYLIPAIEELAEKHEMMLVRFRRGMKPQKVWKSASMYVGVICKKHYNETLHITTDKDASSE